MPERKGKGQIKTQKCDGRCDSMHDAHLRNGKIWQVPSETHSAHANANVNAKKRCSNAHDHGHYKRHQTITKKGNKGVKNFAPRWFTLCGGINSNRKNVKKKTISGDMVKPNSAPGS